MTNTALTVKQVDFNGDNLIAIQEANGDIYTSMAYVCNGVGLTEKQKDRQVANAQVDLVLKQGTKKLPLKFGGQVRETTCILINFLPLWLAKISITPKMRLDNPELVEKLIAYQIKAKDVLAAAFLPQPKLDPTTEWLEQVREGARVEGKIRRLEQQIKTLRQSQARAYETEHNPDRWTMPEPGTRKKLSELPPTYFNSVESLYNDMADDWNSFTTIQTVNDTKSEIIFKIVQLKDGVLYFQVNRCNTSNMLLYGVTGGRKVYIDNRGTVRYEIHCKSNANPIVFTAIPKKLKGDSRDW